MKTKIILISLVMILALLLLGCTQPTSGNSLMGLDNNANSSLNDSNSIDSNSNVFNNLGEFKKVKAGDHVSVDYTGKLTDGNVFDSSVGKEPLEFDVGAGQMIKGFDDGVLGMKVGETKTITIPPEQAYGAVKYIDANQFADPSVIKIGAVFSAGNNEIKIASVDGNKIGYLPNSPLAGKTLVFEITLISIN